MGDKLSNMVACINRATKQRQLSTLSPNTRIIRESLTLLYKLGYIRGFVVLDIKKIRVFMKYSEGEPALRSITRVSKPGNRVYTTCKH